MKSLALSAGALLALTSNGHAQSFNLDCGSAGGTPSVTHSAAGLPGFWNQVSYDASAQVLSDSNGADGALMDDMIDSQVVVTFNGLEPGNYRVLTYAWSPDSATYATDVSVVDSPEGVQTCGGVWPGMHSLGVTYADHAVAVDAGTSTITITTTVNSSFASLNAIQLEHMEFVSLGVGYCSTAPNSADAIGAILFASGSTSLAANDLVLSAGPMAVGEPGLFYYGPAKVQAVFGDGFRCVGGPTGTVVRLFPFSVADAAGVMTYSVNTMGPANAQLTAGAAFNFQAWFRDPAAGMSGFNLSDARALTFQP